MTKTGCVLLLHYDKAYYDVTSSVDDYDVAEFAKSSSDVDNWLA